MKEKEEIEVKFYVSSFEDALREKVEKIRLEIEHFKKNLEINILFDDQQGSLKKNGEVLRLRKWGDETTLTFKGPKTPSKFKKRLELEVGLDRFQEAKKVLEKLGFRECMKYEKRREKLKFILDKSKLEVCFDEMPYGNFVEIEGSEKDILDVVEKLGFDWKNRIVEDYVKIFEDLRKERNLDFLDLTFKNFENVDPKILCFGAFIRRYYLG